MNFVTNFLNSGWPLVIWLSVGVAVIVVAAHGQSKRPNLIATFLVLWLWPVIVVMALVQTIGKKDDHEKQS